MYSVKARIRGRLQKGRGFQQLHLLFPAESGIVGHLVQRVTCSGAVLLAAAPPQKHAYNLFQYEIITIYSGEISFSSCEIGFQEFSRGFKLLRISSSKAFSLDGFSRTFTAPSLSASARAVAFARATMETVGM